jgi:hypothetical protein
VAAQAHEWQKLERLCRYITRPAIAEQRLSFPALAWVRYGESPNLIVFAAERRRSLNAFRRHSRLTDTTELIPNAQQ